jgi:Tfp pilus assembly protein PilX
MPPPDPHNKLNDSMKPDSFTTDRGSVLLVALLTITILTLICATSLYVTSQNANAGMQTASWQQALTGAESGVDAAIRALNEWNNGNPVPASSPWANWKTNPGATAPTIEPAGGSTASTAPDSSHYNYLPSSALALTMQGEGATTVSTWVTIDTAGTTFQDSSGNQWYRIRSTGQTIFPTNSVMTRVSNNKLDDILRNTIALRFNRKGGATLGPSRTVEVIAKAVLVPSRAGTMGIVSRNTFTMGGNGYIDSFDSSNPLYSTNGQYVQSKHESHGDVGILNSTGSTLNNGDYVWGNLTYTGPAVQHTQNVQGTISTPFNATVPSVSAPNWTSGYLTALPTAHGNVTTIVGGQGNPALYKVSQINLSGHQSIVIQPATDPVTNLPVPSSVEIWITGDLITSGNAGITQVNTYLNQQNLVLQIPQADQVHVTYYVEGTINLAGNSIANQNGYAADLLLYGVTPTDGSARTAYIAGNGSFIGLLDAPAYYTIYAGNGDIMGAVIANTLTIQGNGSLHYDQALSTLLPALNDTYTYSFASWFEDNSDPARRIIY